MHDKIMIHFLENINSNEFLNKFIYFFAVTSQGLLQNIGRKLPKQNMDY